MNKLLPLFIILLITQFPYGVPYSYEQVNEELINKMTLREKIGQLCIVATAANDKKDHELVEFWREWQPLYHLETPYIENLIKEYHIGGVIFYGKYANPEDQLSLTKHFQSLSAIPLLITLDAEVGLGSRLNQKKVLRYPYNMTLGAIQDENLTYETAFQVGQQLKMLGVHVNFAPVVDVNNNPKNPVIRMRSFGSDKNHVAAHGIAYMKGLQDAGIIACAKHFPGHGDTSVDSHLALPTIPHSSEHLIENELFPFKQLIDEGVKSVMTAHLDVPSLEKEANLPSSLSKMIVTDLLKKEMGFEGLVFTDCLGMKALADHYEPGEAELKALQAGNDLLVCPLDVVKAINRIEKAVYSGEISEQEINQKVVKILQAKQWAFQNRIKKDFDLDKSLNSPEAQQLIKSLYTKAITLAKSKSHSMPFFPAQKTVVINTDPELIHFEEAIRAASRFQFTRLTEASDLKIKNASHLIISISRSSLETTSVKALKEFIDGLVPKEKIITLLLFGDPYMIPDFNEYVDNIIVAYETEIGAQAAIVEVLMGRKKPEGILPVEIL